MIPEGVKVEFLTSCRVVKDQFVFVVISVLKHPDGVGCLNVIFFVCHLCPWSQELRLELEGLRLCLNLCDTTCDIMTYTKGVWFPIGLKDLEYK